MIVRGERWKSPERLALAAFVVYLAVAHPLLVFYFGKDEWFIRDDWQLIVPGTLPTVFSPMEEHWITLPTLVARGLFHVFGANYPIFLALVDAEHLGIAALLRVIMRRAGVGPWLATACAALLPLFGPGYVSIIFSIGITQDSSMLLGLSQLVLASHDGPIQRRDWVGLFLGALAIASSGVAPIVAVGIGLAVLLRRGARVAAFHTVPLAALYLTWFAIERPMRPGQEDAFSLPFSARAEGTSMVQGMVETFRALGHFGVVAALMAAVLVIGVASSFRSRGVATACKDLSAPLGLLACAPLYFAVLYLSRSRAGLEYVGYSHHLYTGVCFVLPALACGAHEAARRWRPAEPLLAAAFLGVVPFHTKEFSSAWRNPNMTREFTDLNKRMLLALAHSPSASQALHLDRSRLAAHPWYVLPLGWVLDQAAAGRFPKPAPDPFMDDLAQMYYGFTDLGVPAVPAHCPEYDHSLDIHPRQGETIVTSSPVAVYNVRHGRSDRLGFVFQRQYYAHLGHTVRIELPDLVLRLEPVPGARSFAYCSPSEQAAPSDDALKQAIARDPKAMEALRQAIEQDPAAMEALRKEMQAAPKR